MASLIELIKYHRHRLTALTALLAALFLLVAVRPGPYDGGGGGGGDRSLLRESLLNAVGPVQRMLQAPVVTWRNVNSRVGELTRLDRENRLFRAELVRLRPVGARLEELQQENRRLRALLAMPDDPAYREVTARVVGESSSAFARSLIVNAGRDNGVSISTTVVIPNGLLGRVVHVAEHSALVLTLADINSRVPVRVQRSRAQAIATGLNNRYLSLEFLPKEADIRVGDLVVTSGTGDFFPKGLLVGRVDAVSHDNNDLFQKVMLLPAVDFDRTEEVQLLVPMDNDTNDGPSRTLSTPPHP